MHQQFRLTYFTQTVNFSEHVHAQLHIRRGEQWAIIGVFQFYYPAEWEVFQEVCANENIEIVYEPKQRLSA